MTYADNATSPCAAPSFSESGGSGDEEPPALLMEGQGRCSPNRNIRRGTAALGNGLDMASKADDS